MRKTLLISFVIAIVFTLANSFTSYHHYFRSSGYANNFDNGATGAAFETSGQTCGSCHTGGSYNPTISISLLDINNNTVTSYTPGNNYTFRVRILPGSGTPSFGFQATCAINTGDGNYDGWGNMPTNVNNIPTSGTNVQRNYVEQGAPLSSGTINMPWTAPTAGTGSVSFYARGNCVDGSGGTSGDNETPIAILSIAEGAPIPVKLSSFAAKADKNGIQITWETQQEVNHKEFVLEHSRDGIQFQPINTYKSEQANSSVPKSYQYVHKSPVTGTNFYRLKDISLDNRIQYSQVITSNWTGVEQDWLVLTPNRVSSQIILSGNLLPDIIQYRIADMAGQIIQKGNRVQSYINVSTLRPGNYILMLDLRNAGSRKARFVKE